MICFTFTLQQFEFVLVLVGLAVVQPNLLADIADPRKSCTAVEVTQPSRIGDGSTDAARWVIRECRDDEIAGSKVRVIIKMVEVQPREELLHSKPGLQCERLNLGSHLARP